jgi:hypothetical protein
MNPMEIDKIIEILIAFVMLISLLVLWRCLKWKLLFPLFLAVIIHLSGNVIELVGFHLINKIEPVKNEQNIVEINNDYSPGLKMIRLALNVKSAAWIIIVLSCLGIIITKWKISNQRIHTDGVPPPGDA